MAATRGGKKKRARDPHPQEELAALEARVKAGLPPAVLLRGAEGYYRSRGARVVLTGASARGDEICRHDAKDPEFSLTRLLDDLIGGALFAGARSILVERADGLLKKGSRDHAPALVDAIRRRLESGQEGCVILGVDTLRADHALYKAIVAAGGVVVGCRRLWDSPPPWDPDPRRSELVQWLLARARERRVEIGPDEAVYLARAVGNDLSELEDRLESLRERGGRGLREIVQWDAGASPWDVAERLVDGDVARAAAGIEALFQGGFRGRDGTRTVDPVALINLLTSAVTGKVREAVAAASLLQAGGDEGAAVACAGVRGGPQAQRAFLSRVRARPLQAWERMLEDVGELERKTRSGARVDANDLARLSLRWARRARR